MSYVLQAEPTMRIVLTACRLAQSLRRANENADALPVFDFWVSSLRTALDEDTFWGPSFWKDSEQRVLNLENGIHQMVRQCMTLESLVRDGKDACRNQDDSVIAPLASPVGSTAKPAKLGTYINEGEKLVFVSEESSWMQNIVIGCWTTLLADAANAHRTSYKSTSAAPPVTVHMFS